MTLEQQAEALEVVMAHRDLQGKEPFSSVWIVTPLKFSLFHYIYRLIKSVFTRTT